MATRNPRPFGRLKKKPRGITLNKMKHAVICSYCDKLLDGCPKTFNYNEYKLFLHDFDKQNKCYPRHCNACTCTKCFGSDTDADCSSTDPYEDSDSGDSDSLGYKDDPDYQPLNSTFSDTDSDTGSYEPNINSNFNEFRIMNLEQVRKHVSEITLHAALCPSAQKLADKGEAPIALLGEVQQQGMASFLHSTCNGCGETFSFCTSPKVHTPEGDHFEINVRAVWSQMSTGGGCSKLNEQAATLGMPGLQRSTYSKIEEKIGHWWKKVLQEEMLAAGMEERKLAEEAGDFHEGIPAITVIIDAGWSKMSHKHTYNAPGGVGIVVGARTKKLLYIGVKVKTCFVCTAAENKGTKAKTHDCGKNWTGSSQAMEAAVFLEAFSECESVHGLRYMRIIGDGDSNTLSKLISEGPHWCKHIVKIECANHACKCLRSSLEKLVEENPHYKGKHGLSKVRMVKISAGVRCAIRMRNKEIEKIGKVKAIAKLKRDIQNAPWHVFGHHTNCSKDFCLSKTDETSTKGKCTDECDNTECSDDDDDDDDQDDEYEDVIAKMAEMWDNVVNEIDQESSRTDCGSIDRLEGELLRDVSIIISRLVAKADKLIDNQTSNLAENWMAIRSKFDGGKKVNHCGRLSWHWRCFGAGLRRNLGTIWSASVWETCTGTPASVHLWKYGEKQQKMIDLVIRHKAKPEVKKRAKLKKLRDQQQSSSNAAKRSYGPEADQIIVEDDIPSDDLKKKCEEYYTKHVKVSDEEIRKIEQKTILQSACGVWYNEKHKRLTASNFGEVVRKQPGRKVEPFVRRLLYSTFKGNSFARHGLQQEHSSIMDYEAKMSTDTGQKIQVHRCGLFVSKTHPFLGASPDGVVSVNGKKVGLFEVKNVLKNKPVTFESHASKPKTKFCLGLTDGKLHLLQKHDYYFQIQGQLNVCGYDWCDFVVRSVNPHQIFIQRIARDDTLWKETMLPKLEACYHRVLLPELAVPRMGKMPGIREPGHWVRLLLT